MDYKLADDVLHERFCGVKRTRIAENLQRLIEIHVPIWIRVPVIPGANACEEFFQAMAEDLTARAFAGKIELLPFHRLGAGKYDALGHSYAFADTTPPSEEEMEKYRSILRESGLACW